MKKHKIAVIAGDGIGTEVMPEALGALKVITEKYNIDLELHHFDWSSAQYYQQHGQMLPDDWFEQIKDFDAILFGAVGWPDIVPDHVSLWGSLLKFRRDFDQYINMRPVRLMPGVESPLANKKPGDIDFVVIRENTEGEYTNLGGKIFEGTDREVVIQESVFTRIGVDRVLKYAFEVAQTRPAKHVSSATKSNGLAISMPYWDERLENMAQQYPDIRWDKHHIDIMAARFVLQPEQFDVVVASNLFGDILSDLGPACTGTVGIAPSANLNPERKYPSLFEPVHGSAPDISGKNIANPIAMLWSAAMMIEFLGDGDATYEAAYADMMAAIEHSLEHGPRTTDLGGTASTTEVGQAVTALIAKPI